MDSYLVIVFISLGCLVIGVKFWQKGNLLIAEGITASATIYKNNLKHGTGSGRGSYFPVVRFLTENQEWITQELSIGHNPPMKVGRKVVVIYDPEDPTKVDIKSTFRQVILPRVLVAIGLTGILASLLDYLEIMELGL